VNRNLLDLELLESWEALFFYEIHVMKTFNHLLDQIIEPLEILILIVEAENQLFKILCVHDHNLSQGVILSLAFLVRVVAILLLSSIGHIQEL